LPHPKTAINEKTLPCIEFDSSPNLYQASSDNCDRAPVPLYTVEPKQKNEPNVPLYGLSQGIPALLASPPPTASSITPKTVLPKLSVTTGLYAPSSISPLSFDSVGVYENRIANSWSEATIGGHLGVCRQTVYGGDDDSLRLLYDVVRKQTLPEQEENKAEEPPRELSKVSWPLYRIEPPDTLELQAIKLVPRPSYRIAQYDVVQIGVTGSLPRSPINNYFLVDAEGTVNLNAPYGLVRILGMTLQEAEAEITKHLRGILEKPIVTVQLVRAYGTEQIAGIFQVAPDGTIDLHGYGRVYVAGKTVSATRQSVEQHIAEYFDSPEVLVEVLSYNSKSFYIIVAGAETGEAIQKFGMTGNETVLDAVSQIQGLPRVSSKTMWVARSTPGNVAEQQILPVDWVAITRGAVTDTNYQLLPGDRLYIVDDKLVAADNYLAKFTNPIGRALNITNLGSTTIRNTQTLGRTFNQSRRGR
jgi:polysaccharide export outer membrane protein